MININDIAKFTGKITYVTPNGKQHRYYPDIYIISENKVIEVKSEYTMSKNIEVNLLKMKATLDKRIGFEFKII